MKSFQRFYSIVSLSGLAAISLGFSANAQYVDLPAPQTEGGKPLLNTLKERKTERKFSNRELTWGEISNLLWAADGVTRPDGRRTSPTARNAQEIDLYVVLKDAVYLYDPSLHKLSLVLKEDIRPLIGNQPFVAKSPVNILMVLNGDKVNWVTSKEEKMRYGAVDSGFIGQNIYLYCSSAGLASVFRAAGIQREEVKTKLNLPASHEVLYAHTVGFPKDDQPKD